MTKLIKLHMGLIQYLKVELKKKRTSKALVMFFKDLSKRYANAMLNEYKTLFLIGDADYQKQKKEYEKYQQYRKDISNAWKIIQYMIKQGENRNERKQIRRDFEKHGRISKELEVNILKDIYGVERKG